MHNRLPEGEPSASKHAEDIVKNLNINLRRMHFVGSYCTIFGQPSYFVFGKYLLP
jgi:hypothetical protein